MLTEADRLALQFDDVGLRYSGPMCVNYLAVQDARRYEAASGVQLLSRSVGVGALPEVCDEVVEALRQQRDLASVLSPDEPPHVRPPRSICLNQGDRREVFTQPRPGGCLRVDVAHRRLSLPACCISDRLGYTMPR